MAHRRDLFFHPSSSHHTGEIIPHQIRGFFKLNVTTALVFAVLIGYNIASSIPAITTNIALFLNTQKSFTIAPLPPDETSFAHTLPNIYYVILDEYSDFDMIEKYHHYDNTSFYRFLIDRGFNISRSSSNPIPSTRAVITDVLNFSHITNSSDDFSRFAAIRNANIFPLLEKFGYTTKIISSWPLLKINSRNISPPVFLNNNCLSLFFHQSLLRYLLPHGSLAGQHKNRVLSAMRTLQETASRGTRPSFTFCHILSPHTPYFADESGRPLPAKKIWDQDDPSVYVGQFNYITQNIMALITAVLQDDPDCVFLLQSDHGMRGKNMKTPFLAEDTKRILNALYFRGQRISLEGLSGVNTVRVMLNNSLNLNLPIIHPDYDCNDEE